jgi:hypothetical protein
MHSLHLHVGCRNKFGMALFFCANFLSSPHLLYHRNDILFTISSFGILVSLIGGFTKRGSQTEVFSQAQVFGNML